MHLVWCSLFMFIRSVICINESDVQSDVQRRYSVNHPPSAEENNPIPVSVVYNDDIINLKPHIPKYYDISLDRDFEQKSSTEGTLFLAPKEVEEIEPISKNKTESETEDILVRPTEQALGELHIPVAVIYDSLPVNTQSSQAVDQEETNVRRKIIKRVSRRKPLQNKTTYENENSTNQSTTKPKIENEGVDKSEIQMTKPLIPQLSRTEPTKPQRENDDSVKSETPRTKPVKPQLSRPESASSQIENDDSVKSETLMTNPVKPQLSRTFAKPQIENDDSVKSETPRTKPARKQLRRAESTKPQIDNDDSFKSETHRTKPAQPQLSRAESTKPLIGNEDSVKSDTQSSIPVKPQLSRSESVKPRRIEARKSPSNFETTAKVEKAKRVRDPVVPIVEMENYVYAHNGNFHYSYEGGDGTKAHSEGQLRSIDKAAGEAVSGGFSYTDKDGNDFSLSYTADENGYRPIGAHLPTPPPIPPAIARALEYLATATTSEPVTKPSVNRAGRSL